MNGDIRNLTKELQGLAVKLDQLVQLEQLECNLLSKILDQLRGVAVPAPQVGA